MYNNYKLFYERFVILFTMVQSFLLENCILY